jgi:dGTPase
MTIRERTEEIEARTLSSRAALSARSRGRARPEAKCEIRTDFQRDRDRVIHCKAFRRLSYKTQVFIAPEEDHYRTRLTHTLEVAQIARTVARGLRLNEDLTEAIALAHDLGHTPFGHAGEEALDEVYREFDPAARFRHNEQSLRVVEVLEKEGRGLNLTWEVRDGILHHAKGRDDLSLEADVAAATLEAQVVRLADRIAYINHDIDDAIRGRLISSEDLPAACRERLGLTHGERINAMVSDVIAHSEGEDRVTMGAELVGASNELKDFMFSRVYGPVAAETETGRKVREVIRSLFSLYWEDPGRLGPRPPERGPARARAIADLIAGMTDRYARSQFIANFLPESWRLP